MRKHSSFILTLLAITLAACPLEAKTKRILVMGDSWSAGMTHRFTGKVFQTVLNEKGFAEVEVVATDETTRGGWSAAFWSTDHKGSLSSVKKILEQHPTIDIVFIVTGGADFLNLAIQQDLSKLSADERAKLWQQIAGNIQKIVDTLLAVRPEMKIVLCDYDYLNNANTAKSFLKYTYHGISQEEFNRCFVELGREKKAVMQKNPRCYYVHNWGIFQHHFHDKDGAKPPLPGGPPDYKPYPGGDITKPSPTSAFHNLVVNDGIHPNVPAHRAIIENALQQVLEELLKTNVVEKAKPK